MTGKIKNENYIQISGWMVQGLGLKGNELLVYALIYGFSQDGMSEFTGSIAYICEWLSCSRPTASKALTELEKKGFIIKRTETKNGVIFNAYKIDLQVVKEFYGGSKKTLQGSKETLQGGSKESLHNNTILNNTRDNTRDNNIKSDATARQSDDIEKEFENLWSLYPRKQGKANALKAYAKARKKHPEIYEIVEKGIRDYVAYIKANKTEPQYIKHGSTWFNQRAWEDDYTLKGRGFTYNDHCSEGDSL